MEPFGLFDLLKMLTPKAENEPPPKAENQEKNYAENEPPTAVSGQEEPSATNACWDFLNRHDERAKRTKR